jgi:hypothetical protein
MNETTESAWRSPCRLGGATALLSVLLSLLTMVALVTVGGPPDTAEETFTVLREGRLVGLLRLELLSLLNLMLYYLTFFGLYAALRRTDGVHALLATALVFVGVTLWIASHSAFSLMTLSDRYAAAATDAERARFLAAGEALMAADMWHSTGALAGGALIECGALVVSTLMLRSAVFGRATAVVGLVTHGLDLLQVLLGAFVPGVKPVVMAVAGPLYLVWFTLVGRRLLQVGRPAPDAG